MTLETANQAQELICSYCKKKGHKVNACRKKQADDKKNKEDQNRSKAANQTSAADETNTKPLKCDLSKVTFAVLRDVSDL